jgi:casein kinase II subunit alpha
MAGMMFQKEPIFKGKTNFDQLIKIAKIVGTESLMTYIKKYKLTLDSHYNNVLGNYPKVTWETFINKDNKHLVTGEGIDLLNKLLSYERASRLTAIEAMNHAYFKPVIQYHDQKANGSTTTDT